MNKKTDEKTKALDTYKYFMFYNSDETYLKEENTVPNSSPLNRRLLSLSKELGKKKWERFCDIGCSQGYTFDLAKESSLELFGVDISLPLLKKAKNHFSNVALIQADLTSLPFKDSIFDFSCSMQVLEHIPRFEKAFSEIVRVSSNKIVMSTDCLTKSDQVNFANLYDNSSGHLHRFNITYLNSLLKQYVAIDKQIVHYPFLRISMECKRKRFIDVILNSVRLIYSNSVEQLLLAKTPQRATGFKADFKIIFSRITITLIDLLGRILTKITDTEVEVLFSMTKSVAKRDKKINC